MSGLRRFFVRLFHLADGANDARLREEIAEHIEFATEENLRAGMAAAEARRQALLKFGPVESLRESYHSERSLPVLESLLQDLRYALRTLARNPGFAVVAILSLALGIGASTSIFSVADAVLLRPLPYPQPDRILRIWEKSPSGRPMRVADPNFDDFATQNNTFEALAAYGYTITSVTGGSEPIRVNVASVSANFFNILRTEPILGRGFVPAEQRLHGSPAVIVSHAYWERYLGSQHDLAAIRLTVFGEAYSVVGVMSPQFDFPAGVAVWMPSELEPPTISRTAHNNQVIGRLRDGVTPAQAQANLNGIAVRLRSQYGSKVDLSGATVLPLADSLVGDVRTQLFTLLAAVGLLLLVACANVAGLLLARASARSRELAVRAALGAGRGRLVQQFLAESFVLAMTGGLLGIVIAWVVVRLLPAILPANLPHQKGIAINAAVLLFALAATLAVAIALGLFTAWRSASADLHQSLGASGQSQTASGSTQRLRSVLVVGEVAATLVILVAAGLLGRSFFTLVSTDPGFRHDNLLTMQFTAPRSSKPSLATLQIQSIDQILARIRAIPGAGQVGLVGAMPVAAGDDLANGTFLVLNGQPSPTTMKEWSVLAQNKAGTGDALYCVASEEYFQTLGIALVRGRLFGAQDSLSSPHVALISQSLARQRWPGQDPVGQLINFSNMDGNLASLTIVGVVADVRARGLDLPPSPIIYVDYRQRGMNGNSTPTLVLRTEAPAAQIIAPARAIFHELAPDVPVKFSTYSEELGGWLAERRFLLVLVGLFAASALALAAVGIYGVVAFSVTRRTQEIGIRMALGARRADVLLMILGEGTRMALAGVGAGLVASIALTRLLSSMLFGITATDPVTFAGVALLLALVALLASYLPARRATRVDPLVALRYE
jgi:predicted permease